MATQGQIDLLTEGERYGNRKSGDMYFPKGIVKSQAFWELSATAIRVYMVFRTKIKPVPFVGSKSKRDQKGKYVFPNINKLQFTYKEAKDKYNIHPSAFVRAIDQLIGVGLIDITKLGSGLHRDITLYGISDRWEQYRTPKFIVMERPKRRQQFGFTRTKTTPVCGS